MTNGPRQLQVKRIMMSNPHEIPDINLQWKYDKENKVLLVRVIKSDFTLKESNLRITEATKEYGQWY